MRPARDTAGMPELWIKDASTCIRCQVNGRRQDGKTGKRQIISGIITACFLNDGYGVPLTSGMGASGSGWVEQASCNEDDKKS